MAIIIIIKIILTFLDIIKSKKSLPNVILESNKEKKNEESNLMHNIKFD